MIKAFIQMNEDQVVMKYLIDAGPEDGVDGLFLNHPTPYYGGPGGNIGPIILSDD